MKKATIVFPERFIRDTIGIASFLRSCGEMHKGEQFVMAEVRARARERVRWAASLGLLAPALLIAPIVWRRPRSRATR
jgi:hypothetical protein